MKRCKPAIGRGLDDIALENGIADFELNKNFARPYTPAEPITRSTAPIANAGIAG